MPSLKKGAYCFATVGLRYVGRYVGRSVGLWTKCCPINIFWPFHLIDTKIGAGVSLNEKMIPMDFQVTGLKVKVKPSFSVFCVVRSIFFNPSFDQYQNWCRGCPQWVDDPYWFSGHMLKGRGQTTLLSPLCCPLNIFWPLHLINTKLGAEVVPNK